MVMNCGRCGKPMFQPGLPVCDSCRKMISKDKTRHTKKMDDRQGQERSLYENIAIPGKNEEQPADDYRHEHYLDTHDASAVWADSGDRKDKRKR